MVRKRRHGNNRAHPGGFVALPYLVIRSEKFAALSPHAVKLLLDLLAQYNLRNNGQLCASWTLMKQRGWKSRDTLGKALGQLVNQRWIILMRQGGLNRASLYAVTFFRLDGSTKFDRPMGDFEEGAWAKVRTCREQDTDNEMGSGARHAGRVNFVRTNTPIVSGDLPQGTH